MQQQREESIGQRVEQLVRWLLTNQEDDTNTATNANCIEALRATEGDEAKVLQLLESWREEKEARNRVFRTYEDMVISLEFVLGDDPINWPWNWDYPEHEVGYQLVPFGREDG